MSSGGFISELLTLGIFQRNKYPAKLKLFVRVSHIFLSSYRRSAEVLSFFKTARSSVHYWVTRFKERVRVSMEVKHRETIALDETVIKVNGKQFYLYAALDVERNEIVLMQVYSHRNYLTTLSFVRNVLKFCKNKPFFWWIRDSSTKTFLRGLE